MLEKYKIWIRRTHVNVRIEMIFEKAENGVKETSTFSSQK